MLCYYTMILYMHDLTKNDYANYDHTRESVFVKHV